MEFCNLWTKFCEVSIQMKPPCLYFHMMLFVFFSILKNEIWKFLSHFATFGSERVIERTTFDHLDV